MLRFGSADGKGSETKRVCFLSCTEACHWKINSSDRADIYYLIDGTDFLHNPLHEKDEAPWEEDATRQNNVELMYRELMYM